MENKRESWFPAGVLSAEVVFFLFKVGEAMLEPSVRLYITEGVCRQMMEEFGNETAVTCSHLADYPDREDGVQSTAASYLMYYKLLINLPALLLLLFCGAWSDRVGRKLPVILSSFGSVIAVIFFMISRVTVKWHVFVCLVFVGAAVRGAFGKSTVMTMAMHSYISDVSSKQARTHTLGQLLSMNYFGYFIGSLLAGFLLTLSEFDFIFGTVILVNCACVLTTIFSMRESVAVDQSENGEVPPTKFRVPFRLQHVKESISVVLRPRSQYYRLHILFFFCTIFIQQACKSGEVDITVLYALKAPLNWSRPMYGYLLATDYACLGLASSVLLPCLIRFLHLNDLHLAIIGVVFKIMRLAMMSYGRYSWVLYLAVVVGCPSALIISSSKSLISKLVGEDELGKTFSLLSCGETISNLIGSLLFTSVYGATVHLMPGLTFLLDCILMCLLLCVFVAVACHMKQTELLQVKSSVRRYGSVDEQCLGRNGDVVQSKPLYTTAAAAADVDTISQESRVD